MGLNEGFLLSVVSLGGKVGCGFDMLSLDFRLRIDMLALGVEGLEMDFFTSLVGLCTGRGVIGRSS